MALNLEGYPNRDSMRYIEVYGLHDAHHVLRGTLRYSGFCLLASALIELGLYSEDLLNENFKSGSSWKELIKWLVKDEDEKGLKLLQDDLHNLLNELGVNKEDYITCAKILAKIFKNKNYDNIDEKTLLIKAKKIINLIKWSGFLDSNTKVI